MTITPIHNKEQLNEIVALLESSYGESVDIKDERHYFDIIKPKHWYIGVKEGKGLGFIRHFPVGTEDLVELELYAEDQVVKQALLAYFVQEWDKNTKISTRLCIQKIETAFISFIIDLSFELNKTYLEWHCAERIPISESNESIVRLAIDLPSEILAIQTLLSSAFGYSSEVAISRNIKEEQIVVLINEGELIGVCLLSAHEIQREIIQIVIDRRHRRKGFGKLFLNQTILLYRKKMPQLQFKLRVEEENEAAIQLYKSIGFKEVSTEYWFLRKK